MGGSSYELSFVLASSSLPKARAGDGFSRVAAKRAPVRAENVFRPGLGLWIRLWIGLIIV
jgi:hypothetical protein